MSTPAVSASGARSVAVGGDVVGSVIVTGDNVTIQVGAGGAGGTLLDRVGRRQRVRKRARRTPLDVRPPPFADRVDRESELAALASADAAVPLSVTGEALVGKTYVVRAALAATAEARTFRDGVVYLGGGGRTLQDLLQALWEEFYESTPPMKPSDRDVRVDLAERQALIVVDGSELEHGAAQELTAALPRSRIVLASRERQLWDGGELAIFGLSLDDALGLFERDLGRAVSPAERDAAAAICAALGGHPQRLRQAAALASRGGQPLDRVVASLRGGTALPRETIAVTDERERAVLAALEPFGRAPVAAEHLELLAGAGAAEAARSLVQLGLAVSHSPSFSLAVELADAVPADRLDAARSAAVGYMVSLGETEPARLGAESPAALSLLRHMVGLGRWRDVVRLGRVLAPACVLARRFGAWAETTDLVGEAAERLHDAGAAAWALHERGTHALCHEDPGGRETLREALELRRQLHDEAGMAATRHNLQLPLGPPWYLRRVVHLPVIMLLGVLVLLATAGGIAVANWASDDSGPPATTAGSSTQAGRQTLAVTIVGDGTVKAGSRSCPESCALPFDAGTQVKLRAIAEQGWRFAGWDGDCSGKACTLTLDDDRQVTATFAELGHTLTIELDGGGTITSRPAGISCPTACSARFDEPRIILSAVPDDGQRLADWGVAGCAATDLECVVPLPADMTIRPTFAPLVILAVDVPQGGTVVITAADGTMLTCPKECTARYPVGSPVTLTATPSDGFADPTWQGTPCPQGPICQFAIDADTRVTAAFTPITIS